MESGGSTPPHSKLSDDFLAIRRYVEVAHVQLVNLFNLGVGERSVLRCTNELVEMLLPVDVGQRGEDRRVRVEPQQRELAHRHAARLAERTETLDLLHALDQPRARAVRAMIVGVELRVDRVLPLEHARGVRDANEELRGWIRLPGA